MQNINAKSLPAELDEIKFDTIISTEVIEHLYDPKGYIDFCKKILLKNGSGVRKFSEAINEILNSDSVQMGENGRKYVEENFGW